MQTASILIVEDESIIALDIKQSLLNAGYEVVAIATSASEALEGVAQFQPHLVLMDIRIKGEQDGVETAKQIRDRFQLPVVYLTAHADESTLQRAKLSEPFGYVLKPFEDRELITAIEMALSRHHAEAVIREALDQQRNLHEQKSRFIAVVSHEFRNPLNTILFSTELLQRYRNQLSDEKRDSYFERIQSSVKRMNQLLDDVLAIGETESGKVKFTPQPLNLIQFCQTLIDEFQSGCHNHCPILFNPQGWERYEFDQPPALNESVLSNSCTLATEKLPCLDEKLLRHILTNLLSNAIKYSPQGGSITFDLICNQQEVVFRLQDQGIGIPESDQSRLFGSFHRASNVKSIPGTGLGLSIVKQCVDLHGGTIAVTSVVNQGTTFTVTLPLSQRLRS